MGNRRRKRPQDQTHCPTGYVVELFEHKNTKKRIGFLAKGSRFSSEYHVEQAQVFVSAATATMAATKRTSYFFTVCPAKDHYVKVYDVFEPGYQCEKGGDKKKVRVREFWVGHERSQHCSPTPDKAVREKIKDIQDSIKSSRKEIDDLISRGDKLAIILLKGKLKAIK